MIMGIFSFRQGPCPCVWTIPPPTPHRISREKLLQEVNETMGGEDPYPQIVLITAPAGYGKSTFAGEWIESLDESVAWFSIDENDNDPHRFFTYLIHALRRYEPNFGKASLDMMGRYSALAEGTLSPEGLLTPLLNELYLFEKPLYLILDQYHHIEDTGIHEAMEFFLSNLPPQLKPVILSRSEPPWPLHQWRSTGRLLEINREHLRFSREETETFIKEKTGFIPDEEDVKALQEKTEGWPTALQLITGSFGKPSKIQELIRNLSGDHQRILHYLTEETLNRQTIEIREFLLKTSQVPRFSTELCDAILKRTDSRNMINHLLKENLFLIPLDEEGKWYRYHPLFQDILAHHQRQEGKFRDEPLFQIIGKWFEEEGDPAEALRSYGKADDHQSMARVLDKEMDFLWETEGFKQVLSWLEALPDQVRNQSMRLMVYGGFMYLLMGNIEETQRCFAVADGMDDKTDREALGILETLRTTFHLYSGNMKEGFVSAEKALELLPEDSYFWRISGAVVYGDVKVFSGDLTGAYEVYQDAYRWSRRSGNALSTVSVAMNLLKVLWMKGELHEARRFAEETIKIAREEGYSDLPRMGVIWVFLGEYLREAGNLEEAERCANRGLALCEPERILYGMCCIFLAGINLSKKTYDEGLEYMDRMEAMKREAVLPEIIFHLMNSWKSRLLIETDDMDPARELLNEVNLEDLTTIFFPCSPPMVHARLLLLKNQLKEGTEAINALKNLPQYDTSRRLMIDTLLLEAHLEERSGMKTEAEEKVIKAMKVGKGFGFYQTFLDEGRFVAPVFQRLLSNGKESPDLKRDSGLRSFLETLGKGLGIEWEIEGDTEWETKHQELEGVFESSYQKLVEELTERELEILRAISRGLSNVEISETMYLSIHTVKWHNKNIFGKLGVSSRTQAVVRGRELKLIN